MLFCISLMLSARNFLSIEDQIYFGHFCSVLNLLFNDFFSVLISDFFGFVLENIRVPILNLEELATDSAAAVHYSIHRVIYQQRTIRRVILKMQIRHRRLVAVALVDLLHDLPLVHIGIAMVIDLLNIGGRSDSSSICALHILQCLEVIASPLPDIHQIFAVVVHA